MAEEISFHSEIARTTPDIHFERGIHPKTSAELQRDYQRFLAGDTTVHAWNKEVAKSMAQYQPQYTALDGLTPRFNGGLERFLGYEPIYGSSEEKQQLWFAVPARPSEINKQGVVSVVAGD